jgi:hypothetical protein
MKGSLFGRDFASAKFLRRCNNRDLSKCVTIFSGVLERDLWGNDVSVIAVNGAS